MISNLYVEDNYFCYHSLKNNVVAARALAVGLLRQDHVWITTNQLVRFPEDEFDEMLCKVDSSEFARLFEQNPTLP